MSASSLVTYTVAVLLLILIAPGATFAQSQNPSPMVETSRTHERLERVDLSGVADSIIGPGGAVVRIFVPNRATPRGPATLVIHFHGAAWIAEQSVAALEINADRKSHV